MSTTTPGISRRHALRLLGGGVLAAAIGFRTSSSTDAARSWCRADPVLRIAGQKVHVYISSPPEMLKSATDKIRLTVTLPPRISGKLIDIEADFDEGYDVEFKTSKSLVATDDKIQMQIAVYCPARDSSLPVMVEVVPVGDGPVPFATASGNANSWIRFSAG